MSEQVTPPPSTLSELHRLKLQLQAEKEQRLKAQLIALNMQLRNAEAEQTALVREKAALSAELKATYDLKGDDEILTDGRIVRKPAS